MLILKKILIQKEQLQEQVKKKVMKICDFMEYMIQWNDKIGAYNTVRQLALCIALLVTFHCLQCKQVGRPFFFSAVMCTYSDMICLHNMIQSYFEFLINNASGTKSIALDYFFLSTDLTEVGCINA